MNRRRRNGSLATRCCLLPCAPSCQSGTSHNLLLRRAYSIKSPVILSSPFTDTDSKIKKGGRPATDSRHVSNHPFTPMVPVMTVCWVRRVLSGPYESQRPNDPYLARSLALFRLPEDVPCHRIFPEHTTDRAALSCCRLRIS